MSTWSAFTVGGYDPLMTNQEQQDARQDAKAQLRNQVQYDIWRTNVLLVFNSSRLTRTIG